jgi:hypothetical protein
MLIAAVAVSFGLVPLVVPSLVALLNSVVHCVDAVPLGEPRRVVGVGGVHAVGQDVAQRVQQRLRHGAEAAAGVHLRAGRPYCDPRAGGDGDGIGLVVKETIFSPEGR